MAKRPKPKANELPQEVVEKIRADVTRWHPRLWQEEKPTGPSCTCGLSTKASLAMHFNWDGRCQRHLDRVVTAVVKLMDYVTRDLVCDCGECDDCEQCDERDQAEQPW